jgi:transposase InsO family protein
MEEIRKLEKRHKEPQPPRGLTRRGGRKHPFELRLKAVKLRLEEGFPPELIARELGIGISTLAEWVRRYRQLGEQGLKPASVGRGRAKLAAAVKTQITELKQQHPRFGVKKIAQMLRRVLFLPGSHETVRRTLHQHHLMQKTKAKPKRNPPKPRFFERSTPNQMWQTDIFTFRLGGKNAYLIGFIDDHSRYIVGMDLFRSQTAEHVLEVYRTVVGEYGLSKEMLTDNGRQYTAWHGKTRFEQELQKDRVHHFRSQPHHPMTLGKIERYWKTIWEDFLVRAQFDSFEQARERVRLWVKYYNHKRPHQSLDGLCPADRFFAIAKELRVVIERGITDNVQELALRGQPQAPFYMVGRLGQQSVVIRAEKGQVKMQLDDEERPLNQELTYNLKGEPHDDRNQTQKGTEGVQCPPTSAGGALGVDGAAPAGGSLPATGDQQHVVGPVAGPGDGRCRDNLFMRPVFMGTG